MSGWISIVGKAITSETEWMPKPLAGDLPVPVTGGWPDALSDCTCTLRETGIVLGSLLLDDGEWAAMRTATVLSLRIDEHPATDGWVAHHPGGTETTADFDIPLAPIRVPLDALAHGRALSEWAMKVHGAVGRLLFWNAALTWWMVQEPDLELLIICAPPGHFRDGSDELSWMAFGTPDARHEVELLRARYSIG